MDGYVQNLHVMAPEAHQNNRSGLTFNSLCKNLAWMAVTQRTSKTNKTGGWVLARRWALARDNTMPQFFCSTDGASVFLPPGSTDTTTGAYSIQVVLTIVAWFNARSTIFDLSMQWNNLHCKWCSKTQFNSYLCTENWAVLWGRDEANGFVWVHTQKEVKNTE